MFYYINQVGIVNQWESIYHLKRTNTSSPICTIWCENRRTFSFNSNFNNSNTDTNGNTKNSTNSTPFLSKAFHFNFIPSGRMCFLLVSSNGSIEVFLESSEGHFDIFLLTRSQESTYFEGSDTTILDALAYQRPNGTIFISLKSSNSIWSTYEIFDQLNSIKLLKQQKHHQKTELKSEIEKFIWSESKESIIHLAASSSCKLEFSCYNMELEQTCSKIIELPSEIDGIFNSSRAGNYIFLSLKRGKGKGKVVVLNLNGEIVKQLSIELERFSGDINEDNIAGDNLEDVSLDNDSYQSNILISPNGLVITKIVDFDGFPLLAYSTIGEIHPKSKPLFLSQYKYHNIIISLYIIMLC